MGNDGKGEGGGEMRGKGKGGDGDRQRNWQVNTPRLPKLPFSKLPFSPTLGPSPLAFP